MNVDEAVDLIGKQLDAIAEENEDAITWDTEIEIKTSIVNNCELNNVFSDEDQIENMYIYEMFDSEYNISTEKQIEMIIEWVNKLEDLAGIEIDIDISTIE
jgi:hypothetical protein